ncbi:MAG: hypothetical protein AB2A00_02255 [Myxococcota bacterium]
MVPTRGRVLWKPLLLVVLEEDVLTDVLLDDVELPEPPLEDALVDVLPVDVLEVLPDVVDEVEEAPELVEASSASSGTHRPALQV